MPHERLDVAMGVGTRGFRAKAREARPTDEDMLLPNESGAATLHPAPTHHRPAEGRGKVLRVYKWSQFWGKEEVTEFDEAHFAAEGVFQQTSSQGHKEYQDRLRAVHLRKEGQRKADIALALGRSEKFVAKWWQMDEKELPRPHGVHAYLTKDLGRNENGLGSANGASETNDTVRDTATWWRDVEVKRKFAEDPTIYQDIVNSTEWKTSDSRTRDFATGAFHLKYDSKGNAKPGGNQRGSYTQGSSPAMDKVVQRLFAEYGIADRTSGTLVNWYPDGSSYLGSHRHDCWTALFNFGHERILTVDNTPLLMQDGDLCIFGTQRHGVPVMPEVTEGRITFVIFFYPNEMQKRGMWQTLSDPDTMAPSQRLVKMMHERHLGIAAEQRVVAQSDQLRALTDLGFHQNDAETALREGGMDVDRAAELLLLSDLNNAPHDALQYAASETQFTESTVVESANGRPAGLLPRGRFNKRRSECATPEIVKACSGPAGSVSDASTSAQSSAAASSSDGSFEGSDEALAQRLQFEWDQAPACDDEVAALAMQLDELDTERQVDPAMIAAQFKEYEDRFAKEDAESWNGHGDLMHSTLSREHLSIDTMDKVTIYSVGHGDMREVDFWEMVQCNSIRVLYDVRPVDHRGEHHSRHSRFSVAAFRSQCRARGIIYKPMPLGRESAYGMLAHMQSDEARHTLVELVWQAKRKRTAFLGQEENWLDDRRQVAAEELAKVGHTVEHITSTGATERHQAGIAFPDWLTREESRLKMLEKKRAAGDLEKTVKSRTDRSSEAIAAALLRPAEEVDAMAELRNAANQSELVVAQRKLARYQRLADEKGPLAGKVLKNTPQWITREAHAQAEWVSAKKEKKEGSKTSAASSTCEVRPALVSESACAAEPSSLDTTREEEPQDEGACPCSVNDTSDAVTDGTQDGMPTRSTWRSRRRTHAREAGENVSKG